MVKLKIRKRRALESAKTAEWPTAQSYSEAIAKWLKCTVGERATSMKMLAEYLNTAIKFEQMAAHENDPKLKADLERQAAAYRKLAEKRAKENGFKMPSDKNN